MLHANMLRPVARPQVAITNWQEHFRKLADSAVDERLRRYYRYGMVGSDTPIGKTPLMAMDLETTGLDPVRDGIVSIGLVPMTLDRIHAGASRYWLLKPRVDLNETSVTIHGITHTQIADAPDLNDVLDDVLQAMAGHVMVVHFRYMEREFLNGALQPRINETIQFPVIDTMDLEAREYRKKPQGPWARLFGKKQTSPVSIRLADSRSRYHLPHYRPHDARTDALACAELLQAQIAYRYRPDTPVSELWL
jgi:DNA polymerase-3 subunit epsilon